MIYATRGIVFSTIKYSETSIITKIYTELFGLKSYIIKGVRKEKSKTKNNLFQPLNILDMVVYNNHKTSLQYIKETKSAYLYQSVPYHVIKTAILLFINEILYKSIQEEEPNTDIFNFIYNTLINLDSTDENCNDYPILFLIKASCYLGFEPLNNCSEANPYFHQQEGKFLPSFANNGKILNKSLSSLLSQYLDHTHLSTQTKPATNALQRKELLESLLQYYSIHISDFKNIKSMEVLHTILR